MTTKKPFSQDTANPASPEPNSRTVEKVVHSFAQGVSLNALTGLQWGNLSTSPYFESLCRAMEATGEAVRSGDLSTAESMLMAQATALNVIFAEFMMMAHRAEHVDLMEKYARLAFRAQGQCARTLEVLGSLKTPTIIAKQANVTTGPQQVINGSVQQVARVETPISGQNKLLGEVDVELARMDLGEARAGARGNPPMETVAIEHRPSNPKRQSARSAKRQ